MERLHVNLYGVITLCLHQKDVKIRNISILFVNCLLIFVNIVHFLCDEIPCYQQILYEYVVNYCYEMVRFFLIRSFNT